jgi:Sushi domain (SCR repeat).
MVIAPKTDHGMRALFKCKDGFELRGENTTLCQYGEWVGASATCIEGKRQIRSGKVARPRRNFDVLSNIGDCSKWQATLTDLPKSPTELETL